MSDAFVLVAAPNVHQQEAEPKADAANVAATPPRRYFQAKPLDLRSKAAWQRDLNSVRAKVTKSDDRAWAFQLELVSWISFAMMICVGTILVFLCLVAKFSTHQVVAIVGDETSSVVYLPRGVGGFVPNIEYQLFDGDANSLFRCSIRLPIREHANLTDAERARFITSAIREHGGATNLLLFYAMENSHVPQCGLVSDYVEINDRVWFHCFGYVMISALVVGVGAYIASLLQHLKIARSVSKAEEEWFKKDI